MNLHNWFRVLTGVWILPRYYPGFDYIKREEFLLKNSDSLSYFAFDSPMFITFFIRFITDKFCIFPQNMCLCFVWI